MKPIGAAMLLLVGAIAASASELTGVPRIVDGDTVAIDSTKIRLEGIDAPETDQLCLDRNGQRWACGIEARDRLIEHAGGKPWSCRVSGQDFYGRSLASCQVAGEDINRWMVRSGWALSFTSYSHAYDADEEVARHNRAGLWAGAFIAPWDWRRRNGATVVLGAHAVPVDAQKLLLSAVSAAEAPSPECTIKGNRKPDGECIYHVPGGQFYSRLNMGSPGKRWFCTEEEAQAAGCRKSMR
jgi:endonuclease YncB( thermonuclease family)